MLDCEFQHDNRQSRTLEIAKELFQIISLQPLPQLK